MKSLIVASLLVALGNTGPLEFEVCPPGWTEYYDSEEVCYDWKGEEKCYEQYNLKCYKFFGKKTRWDYAQQECWKNEGFLASIKDQATNDFITGTLLKNIPDNTPYHQVYIGGRQINEGGYTKEHWAWTDGSGFDYTNWMDNPRDGGNEDCMSMLLRNDASNVRGKWNDVHCGKPDWLPYICARPPKTEIFELKGGPKKT